MGSNAGSVAFSISPKAQAKTASELSKSMESMRGHLQAQLRCKEAENSRLCMQIKVPARPAGGTEGLGRGSPRAVGPTQEGSAPTVYGALAASALGLWRDSGTVARVVGPGVAQALPLGALPCSDQVGCLDPEPTT